MTSTPSAVAHALSELEAAERALDVAMSALEVAPRAQKIAVSGALEQALQRLRSARSDLRALEETAKEPP